MKNIKTILLVVVFAALSVAGCKGGSANNDEAIDFFRNLGFYGSPEIYSIIGEVECNLCKPDDLMMVNVESERGDYLIQKPYLNDFNSGTYKISDIYLMPGMTINVRVSIGSATRAGKITEVTVPDEGGTIDVYTKVP